MAQLLQITGLLMSVYGLYGMFSGSVLVKHGFGMARIDRDENPCQFWAICCIYFAIGQLIFWALRHHFANM